ncbi:MAG TPA: RHS repeat-associated core domain-containing protein [Thermoanaerobaculia bacterium]|nr:RHS repeat-associated core domain-containing protein [Thermoanaerobaculia bacterium]
MQVTDAPNQNRAHIEVGYSLTGGGFMLITRREDSTGNEVFVGSGNVSGTGSFGTDYFFGCIPPGSYTFKAVLTPDCNPPVTPSEQAVTRTYDTTPTASGSIAGFNDDKTAMTVSFDYSFPYVNENSGPGNRRLSIYIDNMLVREDLVAFGESWHGTKTYVLPLSCLGTGAHSLSFRAAFAPCNLPSCVCLQGVSEPEKFTIRQAEVTSIKIVPIDDHGTLRATVGYKFESTPSDARSVTLFFGSGQYGIPLSGGASGEDSTEIVGSCLPAGNYTVTATAVACRQQNDSRFTDTKQNTFSVPFETGHIDLVGSFDPVGNAVKLTVHQELPAGVSSATRVVKRRAYAGDNGIPVAEQVVDNTTVYSSGTFTLEPPDVLPQIAREIHYDATLSFCGSEVKGPTAVIACPGCDYPPTGSGNPVSFEDANMSYPDRDALPPLLDAVSLTRSYDSHQRIRGLFGFGWTSMFDDRLFVQGEAGADIISLTGGNGSAMFLRRGNVYTQLWPKGEPATGTLSLESATALYVHRPAGASVARLYRSTDGRFAGYRQLGTGHEMRIEYDASGLPQSVRDNWTEVTWSVTVDSGTKRIVSIAAGTLVWQYQYVNDRLTAVLAPGAAPWRTYEYVADRLAAARDELGNLIESHTYDANGRAVDSTGPQDEIASIEYHAAGTTPAQHVTRVTMKSGAVVEYVLQPVGGSWRTVKVSGGCPSCGARDGVYAYDRDGHLTREQNASGYITERVYSGNRLSSVREHLKPANCDPETDQNRCIQQVSALAIVVLGSTAATLTTSYEYGDPAWPDKPTTIVRASISGREEPRREQMSYHPATGDVVSHTIAGGMEQETAPATRTNLYGDTPATGEDGDSESGSSYAPAFNPGGSFQPAWMSLPQPRLRKSVDGPRTDVADVASFVYYPVDSSVLPATLRGRLAAVRNAAGHITRYESYDVFGNAGGVMDPNGVATERTFDALGRLLTSTVKGLAGCDAAVDPLCGTDLTTSRSYSAGSGPVQSEQLPGGGVTTYEYDERGRVKTISRGPSGSDLRERVETAYDPLTGKKSLERRMAFENGSWAEKTRESYSYDTLAQLQRVTHADNTFVAYTHDPEGRVASVRDENHAVANTAYGYDPAGRLASVTQTLSTAPGGMIVTRYSYDPDGNLIALTDPNGNVTTYTYDDLGRRIAQLSPVTGTTRYQYDAAGNLVRSLDANQMMTERTYDPLNRIVSAVSGKVSGGELPPPRDEELPPPPSSPPVETVRWAYDEPASGSFTAGRLSSMVDPTGVTAYAYERRGLLRRESRTLTNCLVTREAGGQTCTSTRTDVTSYGYDRDGNRGTIVYPSGQLMVGYSFDFAGRPIAAGGVITSAAYLPFGPLTKLQFANGTTQTFGYDNRYRIIDNDLRLDSVPGQQGLIAGYRYDYDASGNVTKLQDKKDPDDYLRRFTYDDLNRLLTANTKADTPNHPSPLWGKGEYSWDAMGNILRASLAEVDPSEGGGEELLAPTNPKRFRAPDRPRKEDINAVIVQPLGRVMEFAYDGTTPRMTAVTLNDLSRPVTHDAAGNELSYVVTRTYSPRNLLQGVTDSIEPDAELIHRVAYGYDGRGLRVLKAESPSNDSGTVARRAYVYSPELRLLSVTRNDELNVWEPEADPQPFLGNNVHYEIVWFSGRPVAQVSPGAPTLYTYADHLGTPLLQTDSTATIRWRVEYEPFGSVYEMREGTRTYQPLRFPGQEVAMSWEGPEESYNVFRWYKSSWGRYTQADPIGAAFDLNLFRYAFNNPSRFVDRYGLKATPLPKTPKVSPPGPACQPKAPAGVPPWLGALGGYATAIVGFFFGPFVPELGGPGDMIEYAPPPDPSCQTCDAGSADEKKKKDDECKERYKKSIGWIANKLEPQPVLAAKLLEWAYNALQKCYAGEDVTFPGEGPLW